MSRWPKINVISQDKAWASQIKSKPKRYANYYTYNYAFISCGFTLDVHAKYLQL